MTGIYQIVCRTTGKRYIGSTSKYGFDRRWSAHRRALKAGTHNPIFQNAWNKYGESDFIFQVIEYLNPSECLKREQIYLDTVPRDTLLNASLKASGGNGGANKGMKTKPHSQGALASVKSSNHINNKKINCSHCGKTGQHRNMKRWHLDNCKEKV